MAKDEGTQAGNAAEQAPEDGMTLQERIDRQRSAGQADSASGPDGGAGPEATEVPKDGGPETEAAAGPPADQAGADAIQGVLEKRRAELRAKLRQKMGGGGGTDGAGEAADPAEPGDKGLSLQHIINQQRAQAKLKGGGGPGQPAAEAEGAEGDAAAGADKAAAPGEGSAGPRERAQPRSVPGGAGVPIPGSLGRQRFTEVVMVANVFLLAVIGGVLIYTLSHSSGQPSSVEAAMTAVKSVADAKPARAGPATRPRDANQPDDKAAAAAAMEAAPSWSAAEAAFLKKDYDLALDRYRRHLLASRWFLSQALCRDFFQYRIAQCVWHLGSAKQARLILEKLTNSDSPVIRAVCGADLARMDEMGGQHLQARVLAYRALAALAAIEESLALEADCDYLIARALTEKVGGFLTAEELVPWSRLTASDVFAGRSELAISRLLEAGATDPGRSQPSPSVRIARTARAWTLSSSKAALEDVLHQFAAKIGKDVEWKGVAPAVRRRTVTFTFREVSELRACELACGMAGLMGQFTWDRIVVHDPESITTLSQQKELLIAEAMSAWRRFSLRFSDDERTPEGHFARAALYELAGDAVGAMRQYQLIGRQYQQELALAPMALMRSASLRMGLRDYVGAGQDLQDVLDLYPRHPQTDRVYLSLGEVAMRAAEGEQDAADRDRHLKAATEALLRVHDLNASAESRANAALEAGDCYYRRGEYKEASKWLSRYITLARGGPRDKLVRAYLLLGRSELAQGNNSVAGEAFRRVLAARPLRNEYVEAILALTRVQAAMGDEVAAMATIGHIEKEQLTDDQRYRYVVTVSQLYRSMGLPDRARAFLRKAGPAVSDPKLRAMMAIETGRCLWEAGDLQAARECMSDAMGRLPAGPEAHAAAMELGSICMDMGEPEQAAVFAEEVLRGKPSDEIRRRALEMVGRAYLRSKQYEKAVQALTLLGGSTPAPPGAEGSNR